MISEKTEFRVVLKCFRGWKHKYWVQIYLWASIPLFKTWYDVNDVTPERCKGFRTKKEALAYMDELNKKWNRS